MSNADLIVDASAVHAMADSAPPVTALAIGDGKIATAGPDGRRDLLATWRGPGTVMIDNGCTPAS
jgi:predicted amidohydrolase YtcJ